MKHLFDGFRDFLPVLLLGAFGGIARTIAGKRRNEPLSLWILLQEIVLAVFAGLVIHLLLSETDLWESVKTASVALAGYSSRSVLALPHTAFIRHVREVATEKDRQ